MIIWKHELCICINEYSYVRMCLYIYVGMYAYILICIYTYTYIDICVAHIRRYSSRGDRCILYSKDKGSLHLRIYFMIQPIL